MGKRRILQLRTLLLVGEGAHEKAFLEHMKDLYDRRDSGQRVKVHAAAGGSPESVIRYAAKLVMSAQYDRRYVMIDTDVPVTPTARKLASKHKLELIESSPLCLEGLLLEVLDESPNQQDAQACKSQLQSLLSGDPANKSSYATVFTKELLESCSKPEIVVLRSLLAG